MGILADMNESSAVGKNTVPDQKATKDAKKAAKDAKKAKTGLGRERANNQEDNRRESPHERPHESPHESPTPSPLAADPPPLPPKKNLSLARRAHPALAARSDNGSVVFPRGRPPSAIEVLRAETRDGAELVEQAVRWFRGEPYVVEYPQDALGRPILDENGNPVVKTAVPSIHVRVQLLNFLSDRGVAPRIHVVDQRVTHTTIDTSKLTTEQLRTLMELGELAGSPIIDSTGTAQEDQEPVQDAEFIEE